MPANLRIYYAIQAAGVAIDGTTSYYPIHGLQTLGVNTRFNLDQLFEIGQLALYENVELVPDIEITLEKCLDGWPLMYHLFTNNAASSTLAGRSTVKATMAMSIYPDVNNAASGNPVAQCTCSGLFVSNIGYDFNIDGPARESITAVGNNKFWSTSSFNFTPSIFGSDLPYNTGYVSRRQHVVFNGGGVIATGTVWQRQYTRLPTEIAGISASGTNDLTAGVFGAHVRRINVSANLGRDQLLELGRRGPYFRYVNFPVEVRTDIEIMALKGDLVQADENSATNTSNQTITVKSSEGTYINLGSQNRLQSVNYGGADAGRQGGNATITYSYLTYNDFVVLHPQDPMGFSS